MSKAIIAACCIAFMGGLSAASAQTTAPPGQDDMKTNSPSTIKKKSTKSMKKSTKSGMKKSDDMDDKTLALNLPLYGNHIGGQDDPALLLIEATMRGSHAHPDQSIQLALVHNSYNDLCVRTSFSYSILFHSGW